MVLVLLLADYNVKAARTTAPQDLNVTKLLQDFHNGVANFMGQVANATLKIKLPQATNSTGGQFALRLGNRTIIVTPPKQGNGFNFSTKANTIRSGLDMLQELAQVQPLLQAMVKLLPAASDTSSTASRSLLADVTTTSSGVGSTTAGAADPSSTDSTTTTTTAFVSSTSDNTMVSNDTVVAATTSSSNTLNATQQTKVTNTKKIISRVNLIMSDAWLVSYTGFNVGRACIQLLKAMLTATATGHLTVDASLVLQLSDLASNFGASVSYMLYGIQKLNADAIAPLGLVKTTTSTG